MSSRNWYCAGFMLFSLLTGGMSANAQRFGDTVNSSGALLQSNFFCMMTGSGAQYQLRRLGGSGYTWIGGHGFTDGSFVSEVTNRRVHANQFFDDPRFVEWAKGRQGLVIMACNSGASTPKSYRSNDTQALAEIAAMRTGCPTYGFLGEVDRVSGMPVLQYEDLLARYPQNKIPGWTGRYYDEQIDCGRLSRRLMQDGSAYYFDPCKAVSVARYVPDGAGGIDRVDLLTLQEFADETGYRYYIEQLGRDLGKFEGASSSAYALPVSTNCTSNSNLARQVGKKAVPLLVGGEAIELITMPGHGDVRGEIHGPLVPFLGTCAAGAGIEAAGLTPHTLTAAVSYGGTRGIDWITGNRISAGLATFGTAVCDTASGAGRSIWNLENCFDYSWTKTAASQCYHGSDSFWGW